MQQPFLPWASARTTHGAHLPKLKFCPAFTRNFWHAWSAGAGWHGPRSVDGTRADQQRPNEAVFHQVVHLCGLSPLRMPFRLSVKYLLCWSQSSLPSRPMQKPSNLHHIIIIISGYSPLSSSFYAAPLLPPHRCFLLLLRRHQHVLALSLSLSLSGSLWLSASDGGPKGVNGKDVCADCPAEVFWRVRIVHQN